MDTKVPGAVYPLHWGVVDGEFLVCLTPDLQVYNLLQEGLFIVFNDEAQHNSVIKQSASLMIVVELVVAKV